MKRNLLNQFSVLGIMIIIASCSLIINVRDKDSITDWYISPSVGDVYIYEGWEANPYVNRDFDLDDDYQMPATMRCSIMTVDTTNEMISVKFVEKRITSEDYGNTLYSEKIRYYIVNTDSNFILLKNDEESGIVNSGDDVIILKCPIENGFEWAMQSRLAETRTSVIDGCSYNVFEDEIRVSGYDESLLLFTHWISPNKGVFSHIVVYEEYPHYTTENGITYLDWDSEQDFILTDCIRQ